MTTRRQSQTYIVALQSDGEQMSIPPGQTLYLASELNDWRRVAILWHGARLVISRGAWDACCENPLRPYAPSLWQVDFSG